MYDWFADIDKFKRTHRNTRNKMALPLIAIYYGLLIIGSILFLQVYDQGNLIDGGHQMMNTISDKKDYLLDKITPYVEEVREKLGQFHHEEPTNVEIAYEKVANTVAAKKAVYIYDRFIEEFNESIAGKFLHKIGAAIEQFFAEHPAICERTNEVFSGINKYAEIVYDFSAEKLLTISETGPIKSIITEYGKIHNDYVTPYVENSSEYVSKYVNSVITYVSNGIGEENLKSSSELTYTFVIVIIAVFMCKMALTKLLRMFVKDAFQMNRSVSDMYKNSLKNTTHSPIYETIKQKSEHAMVIDELELVEAEAAANSVQSTSSSSSVAYDASNRSISGSNRNTAESNRREQQQQQQQQEEQQEEEKQEEDVSNSVHVEHEPSRSASISSSTSSQIPPVQPPRTAPTTTQTVPVTVQGTNI
ncbi:hypothetical protein CANINC_003668 [Pichia inconspicua]|uniref:Uncharacterized protein n=1 Tax=Pichia inconspicua TaxID=52247 RepID=A0A4T0WY86_9ASCO|nr:hypothetical protein CANINC_003668 [[Candida] inconspicua]